MVNKASEMTSHLNSNHCTLFIKLTEFLFSAFAAMFGFGFGFHFRWESQAKEKNKYGFVCKMVRLMINAVINTVFMRNRKRKKSQNKNLNEQFYWLNNFRVESEQLAVRR